MRVNLTIGAIAREVGVCVQTIRSYADAGLIPCERDSVGRRMFTEESVEAARSVLRNRRTLPAARREVLLAA